MACDSSGLLASGSHSGVISLLQTGRHATGATMRLLAPHQRLPARTSPETLTGHDPDSKYALQLKTDSDSHAELYRDSSRMLHAGIVSCVWPAHAWNSQPSAEACCSAVYLDVSKVRQAHKIVQERSEVGTPGKPGSDRISNWHAITSSLDDHGSIHHP